MTTDLERRLREALHDDAQRARLVNPGQPALVTVRSSGSASRAGSARRLVAVAATVSVVAAASVALIQRAREDAPDVTTSAGPTQVFTDIPADSAVSLPPAPIDGRSLPAAVWTGTEIILWGGLDDRGTAADGVAFDLAAGRWRVIAPAPIDGRAWAAVAWTGSEMVVWGGLYRDGTLTEAGSYNQTGRSDGAAYDPATDTWRLLPEAPIDSVRQVNAVWTGEEFIVLGGGAGNQNAAYKPETNEWRRLADAPPGNVLAATPSVWTGTSILTSVEVPAPDGEPNVARVLVRYDLSTDSWHRADTGYAALVGIPDGDGVSRTVLGLPVDTGAPVGLLDATGNPIGRLPGHPGDVDGLGDRIEAEGTWLGTEAVFRIRGGEWFLLGAPAGYGPETWALDPATQTWRMLPGNIEPALALGDVLFAWTESPGDVASAVLYRPPTSPGG